MQSRRDDYLHLAAAQSQLDRRAMTTLYLLFDASPAQGDGRGTACTSKLRSTFTVDMAPISLILITDHSTVAVYLHSRVNTIKVLSCRAGQGAPSQLSPEFGSFGTRKCGQNRPQVD